MRGLGSRLHGGSGVGRHDLLHALIQTCAACARIRCVIWLRPRRSGRSFGRAGNDQPAAFERFPKRLRGLRVQFRPGKGLPNSRGDGPGHSSLFTHEYSAGPPPAADKLHHLRSLPYACRVNLRTRITGITSNAGDHVELSTAGVTCLVGGNNAGKSQTLRDIAALVQGPHMNTVVISELELDKPAGATHAEVEGFLKSTAAPEPQQQVMSGAHVRYSPLQGGFHSGGGQMTVADFQAIFHADERGLGGTSPFFLQHWTAGSLVHFASSGLGHFGVGQPVGSPMQRLYRDGDLEAEISNLAYQTFEQHLTLDRANLDVRLRMGRVEIPVPPISHPTQEYADAVAALPPLEVQGDGVKSFLGLALAVVAGKSQIILVDEPESFLHPGQARALGRWLSDQAGRRDIQLIVSTHNRDFVLGLASGGKASTRFVRVVRDGEVNRLHELPPGEVSSAWEDPVLRYSNLLQGLFHRRVAICESDADCRFYGAVLDELASATNRRAQADDTLLVPSGGKHRIAALGKALQRLDVETHAFVDFDALREKATIRGIVESLGGVWTSRLEADFISFVQPVQSQSLWGELKRQGIAGAPSGATYSAGLRLLESLDRLRVHVVRTGEMESFDRSIGEHGSAWVTAALEKGVHRSSDSARAVVEKLLGES